MKHVDNKLERIYEAIQDVLFRLHDGDIDNAVTKMDHLKKVYEMGGMVTKKHIARKAQEIFLTMYDSRLEYYLTEGKTYEE